VNRALSPGILIYALCALPIFAIIDTNNNGLSDLWERQYNGGELFPIDVFPYRPEDDPDGDGWTNAQEVAAGTDPFNANSPEGFVRPAIVHIPESWSDLNGDGIVEHTPEAVTITWPTIPGKQYTLLYSPNLTDWLPVPDETFIGTGTAVTFGFQLTLADGTTPAADKLFWHVKIEDVDSDGDGLTDAEEYELGTDPYMTDSNGDGLSDLQEYLLGPNAWLIDSDGDGISDGDAAVLGIDPLAGALGFQVFSPLKKNP